LNLKDNPKPTDLRKITSSENYYRIKVGDYRIIYDINYKEKRINIFRIRHRKEAYRNL
jgi:mRNA interferase RelE/StbE